MRSRTLHRLGRSRLLWTLSVALALVGCASTPPPPGPSASEATPPASGPATPARRDAAALLREANANAQTIAEAASAGGLDSADATPPPRTRLDPDQDAERADLWERVRRGLRIPDVEGDLVRKWEAWYVSRPDYVQRMTERGGRYLFHVVEEVERRGMPAELALLPFIESAFNPQAMSRAAASGMWQFMPATGKDFELRQNVFRDDRRDVLASTRAALDYLQRLFDRFGDWQLALAAYNWGQGNVQRAIDRNARAGLATDYTSLQRLPQETREYVPKLQAVKNIVLRPAEFGVALPALANHPYFLSVGIERDIDVELAARLAGLDVESFRQLNPQHNKPVILAAGTPQVLLPYDAANRFLRTLAVQPAPLSSWTAWVAPRTLKPADAAHLVGMSEAQLREVNHIPPRMLVKAGSTLLVPRSAKVNTDVPERIADNASIALAPEGPALRRMTFKAGRQGESVASVARRYRLPAAKVAEWNQVAANARFAPGASVVVMLPVRTSAPAGTRKQVAAAPQRAAARPAPRRAQKPASKVRVAQR